MPEGRAAADGPAPTEFETRTLVDQLPAILYVADVGLEGRWHYVSRGVQKILGFSPEEWMSDPSLWARQMHPEDRDRIFDREDDLLEPTVPDEYRMRHRDGSIVWVRDEAALIGDPQGNVRWHGVISDITDRKLAEAELERRAEQQAAVARLGKQALRGEHVGALMEEAVAAAQSIIGAPSGTIFEYERDGTALVQRAGVGRPFSRAPQQVLPEGITAQIQGRHARWGVLWLAHPAAGALDPADVDFVQAIANILADAIQRLGAEKDIRYQAAHDPLTGLPNRVLFMERLAEALSRPDSSVAVVLLDIDHFKLVNDSLGHSAGDELLMQIAPRLRTALRPGDTIARLGGDEFIVLLEEVSDEISAALLAERIVSVFEAPFDLGAGEHFAKASLGIAMAGPASRTPAALVRDADAALYRAKAKGRARFEVFDREMRARTVERLSVENDLRRALDREELRVAYQPIVSLRDSAIVAVEALLRWKHPRRGLIGPAEFIPVAEESGMIEPIGRWVLDSACGQAALWQASRPDWRPLGICVNLSVRQFMQRDLEATVAAAVAGSGIEASSLCLEITESILLEDPEGVSAAITRMARLGVRFVLDDFGTGYSSLAYLSRLPIDGLKVDRSFVQALGTNERSTAITTAIVRMAQALTLDVIAEGVETQEQLDALQGLHCELAQGFHIHRPLPADAISALLSAEHAAWEDDLRLGDPPRR
jgi:diguanylate cyclase (GGDEF)-like protein/PAS domain S-box-containing protein